MELSLPGDLLAYTFEQRPDDVRCTFAARSVDEAVRGRCARYGIDVVVVRGD